MKTISTERIARLIELLEEAAEILEEDIFTDAEWLGCYNGGTWKTIDDFMGHMWKSLEQLRRTLAEIEKSNFDVYLELIKKIGRSSDDRSDAR